ncbi:MAG TPA: NRDE family protein [Candidatus Binataceae bacterium]|nr:NRDE family protein [Candidatus Binataceae bacterium]
MCTLAIYYRTLTDYPVVVAANRDEYLARAAMPPVTLNDHPHVVGGKDLRAGGTWLGINEYGMVAGLLNRRTADYGPADPNLRSRGLLTLEALMQPSAKAAADYVERQRGGDYNAFNLLIASPEAAFVAYNRGGEVEVVQLTDGFHLLTNIDVDDFECPRISRAYGGFAKLGQKEAFTREPLAHRDDLHHLLADHSTQLDPRSGRPNSLCMHLGDYGTRSSSMIFMRRDGRVEHFFASGPPCTTSFSPALTPSIEKGSRNVA